MQTPNNQGRRHFLRNSLAFGGLMATAGLPTVGCVNTQREIFENRGRFERLSLAYHRIDCGAKKPFSILHISDTHLCAVDRDDDKYAYQMREQRMRTFGGEQENSLRVSIAWAKKNSDYLLHTGDLIDFRSKGNLRLVKQYFPNTEGFIGCIGNHEYFPDWWSVKETKDEPFKKLSYDLVNDAYPFNITFNSTIIHGINFVTIDNVYDYVTPQQVALFEKEVEKNLPIVLAMHCPFRTEDMSRAIDKFWGDKKFTTREAPKPEGDWTIQLTDPTTQAFIHRLKRLPQLKAILAGHLHIHYAERFSETAIQYVTGANFLYHGQELLFT